MDILHLPPLNVLNVSCGFDDPQFKYKINPLRIQKPNGRVYKVKEVRHHSTKKQGWSLTHDYVVRTQDEYYLDIVFIEQDLSWWLLEERTPEGETIKY